MLYIIQMLVIWLVHIFGKNKRLLTVQKSYKQCLNRQYINNRNKRFSSSWDLYEKKEIFHMLTVLQCYISHILSVLAIKHKYLAYCVSSRSVHPDLSSFITIKTKFWTGSFTLSVMFLEDHYTMCAWWTKLLLHQSEFRCVTGGLKSRLASRRPPQTRPFREFLCKPRQIIPSITGSPGISAAWKGARNPGWTMHRGVQNICCEGKEWNRSWKLSLAKQPAHMKMLYFLTVKS